MSSAEGDSIKDDKKETGEPHGVKRPVEEVHSVNNWEAVNLGDDDRKQKFLRLMGASKKEHHGKFVIGDQAEKTKHTDASEKAEEITHALEDQYLQGLEMKLTGASRRHVGFGFHEEEEQDEKQESESSKKEDKETAKEEESSNSSSAEGSDSKDASESEKNQETDAKTEKCETEDSQEKTEKKPAYMMGFVKSS